MPSTRRPFRLRQMIVYGLILLALGLMSAVGYVVATGRSADTNFADDFHEEVSVPSSAPTMEFPERMRTYDSEVNRLIDRFMRTTLQGKYSEFRKMWTRKLDPPSADSYARIYGKVREVHVLDVRRAAGANGVKNDAYVLTAQIHIGETENTQRPIRTIRIGIVRENGEWVFAPLPKNGAESEKESASAP